MKVSVKKFLPWLAPLAIVVVVFGTIYVAVQQSQRGAANSPQIQIAEDTAVALNRGDPPAMLLTRAVDIKTSLAPFTIIYDKSGKVVNGSGFLNGQLPLAPLRVLSEAKGKDYHAVTWQPQKDVRVAAVTVAAKDYYVLSGRSLKEVEKNGATTLQLVLLGGLAAVLLLGVTLVLSDISSETY